MHLRDVRELRQVRGLLAGGALVDDEQVRLGGQQAVLEREAELLFLGGGLDPPRGGDARERAFAHDLRAELGGSRERRRAVLRAQRQRDRAERRRVEARERVDRLAAEESRRQRRRPRGRGGPRDVGAIDTRRAHPAEHAQDRRLGVLVRRDELARAAGRFGEAAQHAFGRRAADADDEHALPRATRLGDQMVGVPDLAVGQQQDVGGAVAPADREHLLQRARHLGAAQVRVHPPDAPGRVAHGALVRRDEAARLVDRVAAEARKREPVGRLEAREDPVQRTSGRRDAVAAHRARAVDDELQRERKLRGVARNVGAEARQRDVPVAVLRDDRERPPRQPADREHEVAVEEGAAREADVHAGRRGGDRKRVRRRRELPGGDLAFEVDRERERVRDREVARRDLVRREACGLRVAVAGRDDRGNRQAHAALLEPQQLRVAVADRRRLARHQVAEVERAQAVSRALEHDRGVALVDRLLVVALGRLLLDDRRDEPAVAQRDLEVEQHRVHRERKRVDRLDVRRVRVAVALLDVELEQQPAHAAARFDALERHRLAGGGLEHRGFVSHDSFSLFLMSR